jgi:hypothetical protein
MVKRNKLICIDEDVFDQLRLEDNASALINRLLIEYFDRNVIEQMSHEELKKRIAYEEEKLKIDNEHKAKMKELNDGI